MEDGCAQIGATRESRLKTFIELTVPEGELDVLFQGSSGRGGGGGKGEGKMKCVVLLLIFSLDRGCEGAASRFTATGQYVTRLRNPVDLPTRRRTQHFPA
jgi:hypothetical protein